MDCTEYAHMTVSEICTKLTITRIAATKLLEAVEETCRKVGCHNDKLCHLCSMEPAKEAADALTKAMEVGE